MSNKQLVLIGGGHAHLVMLANLHVFVEKGIQVTVIQPSTHHYYSGMGAGMLGGTYTADEIRFHTKHVVERQGGRFVLDKARKIDTINRTVLLEDSERGISYDVLSCNAGSSVPEESLSISGTDIFTVKPIEGLLRAQQRILELSKERPVHVGIVGGGPSAVEVAGNLCQLGSRQTAHAPVIKIVAGRSILPHAPKRVRHLAEKSLTRRGVEILMNRRVQEISPGSLQLSDGESLKADIVFLAVGVKPSPIFARSGLPIGPEGGLRVNEFLQCNEHADIFGGGDCIYFEPQPLDKVGVYAVRQNPVLYHNVMAKLEGRSLKPFTPGGKYLLIYNLGDDSGIFSKWSLVFDGRRAFRIKDYIDRKFMNKFQVLER
ncbi:MAG: pyridine nucleotide-disulfide oxidoreductase [Desulfobulbaceae bacterium]|nr:pyridine nucleotide-disulfide oxidoreductase [Desulfobulbaceae bacterium]